MTKISYNAKLASGYIVTRKSERAYTHYWRVWGRSEKDNGYSGGAGGFTGSEEQAKKSASSMVAKILKAAPSATIESEVVPVSICT